LPQLGGGQSHVALLQRPSHAPSSVPSHSSPVSVELLPHTGCGPPKIVVVS
jgi:hypothetical protein